MKTRELRLSGFTAVKRRIFSRLKRIVHFGVGIFGDKSMVPPPSSDLLYILTEEEETGIVGAKWFKNLIQHVEKFENTGNPVVFLMHLKP